MAYWLARAHADAGLQSFNELQKIVFEGTDAGTTLSFRDSLRHAVPAATSLSFALELLLKVCLFQRTGAVVSGHPISSLIGALPADLQVALDRSYSERYSRKPDGMCNLFELAVARSGSPLAASRRPTLATLQAAKAHLDNVFVAWRYLHEQFDRAESMCIDFWALLMLIESVDSEITRFRGPGVFTIGEPHSMTLSNKSIEPSRER
jgi:hypothetical protein